MFGKNRNLLSFLLTGFRCLQSTHWNTWTTCFLIKIHFFGSPHFVTYLFGNGVNRQCVDCLIRHCAQCGFIMTHNADLLLICWTSIYFLSSCFLPPSLNQFFTRSLDIEYPPNYDIVHKLKRKTIFTITSWRSSKL